MPNIAVIGAQYGDEGKGAVTHHLSKDFDWVCRYSGAANAGHTIYRDGVKYVHNLIPSFDWRVPTLKAFLGSGMVIDLDQLIKEVETLASVNPTIPQRIYVDPDAFLVHLHHQDEDKAVNQRLGTTNRGVGPAYRDKVARKGTRIKDLIKLNSGQVQLLESYGVKFKHVLELKREMQNSNLLFEGAQGVMIDLNHGTYPYVSCGDSTIAGIYSSGFAWVKLDKVYGVAKCYVTRVGTGPFPTEIHGEEAEALRNKGQEFGATTGRPRRVGYLDLPALDYACKKGGVTHLIMTKFDILNGMSKVKMCVSYQKTPVCPDDFFTAEPQCIELPGWEEASQTKDLREFISNVEISTGLVVDILTCGINPEDVHYWY